MTLSLTPESGERSAVFSIINDGVNPIAIQASVSKREMDETGKEKNSDVEEKFMIFPDQLIVKPGEKRAIKVSSLEVNAINVEEAYRFVAEQLPIDLKEKKDEKTNIKILLKYRAAFYLSPKKGKGVPSLISYSLNKNKLKLTIKNTGNKHILLRDHFIQLTIGKEKYDLNENEMQGLFGENVLAGNIRVFNIKIPKRLIKNINESKEIVVSLLNK